MRFFLVFFAFQWVVNAAIGQTVEETYPKTLWCTNDTFVLMHKGYPKAFPFQVSRKDNGSPGTDAKLDEYATLYYGKDSLRLNYHNKLPYAHVIYVNFQSPKGKTTFRFHEIPSYFSRAYTRTTRPRQTLSSTTGSN